VVHAVERGEREFFFAGMGEDGAKNCPFVIEVKKRP
jgi:hypothetical protein